ncbi:polymeric immunoglobulin receptor [Colius striatus]|uniref:polymeric immunoglobulin receptor n=1 Tax=Colius striatus TaxID=57412 RepID=UPI002B1DD88F|nr:polymeric immunoglobulin receptor [Colius striatus]
MAMELRALLLLPLCFPGLHSQAVEVNQQEGSSLFIRCFYKPQTDYVSQKAWCHVRSGQCEPLVTTTYDPQYLHWDTKGKAGIQDDFMNGIVSISMSNLQVEDSGTYSCASTSDGYTFYSLKTISLNVFKELHKGELDSLSVQCLYGTLGYSTGRKVWCRIDKSNCINWLRANYPSTQTNSKALEKRILIEEDTQKEIVTMTMKKLQTRDNGVYWCALIRDSYITRIMEVKLSVFKRTQQYTAMESGNVSVQCNYNTADYGAVSKAWCRQGARNACTILYNMDTEPLGYLKKVKEGRVSMQDDTRLGIVTITMEKLQAQDSGMYWCALYERQKLFRMVEVTLNISEVIAVTTLSSAAGTSQATPGNATAPSSNVNTYVLLSGILSILFILAIVISVTLCIRQPKQLERRGNRQADHIYEKPVDMTQLDSTERMESPKDESKDLEYVTLNFKSQLSPEDPLYCNVNPSQTHRKPRDESVEYATIALKQTPTNGKG